MSTASIPWGDVRTRVAWARAWRRAIARRHAELAGVVSEEIGKSVFECFVSEIVPLLRAIRSAERWVPGLMRERRVGGGGAGGLLSPGVAVLVRREPVGRVAIIATWNYPVGLMGVELAHALIAGNRVVVKPSERSPRSQGLLLGMAREPGGVPALPAGVLEWTEATRQAGADLLDPVVSGPFDHVVFTGSTEVGRQIARGLGESLTPSTLELSGRDSAIVLDDADAGLAARSIWSAVRMNAGQTCMGPRRAIVCGGAYEAFVRALEPLVRQTSAVRLVNDAEAVRAWAEVPAALSAGARSLGHQAEPPVGRTMRALALIDCPPGSAIVEGRHFGPVLAVVRARDEGEALEFHDRIDQCLATSVFTRDVARARRVLSARLGSGIVTINDCLVPTGHPGVGLGGRGASGWGVSRGREGLASMTRAVSVTTTHAKVRTPTTMLEGKAADRYMRFASGLLGR